MILRCFLVMHHEIESFNILYGAPEPQHQYEADVTDQAYIARCPDQQSHVPGETPDKSYTATMRATTRMRFEKTMTNNDHPTVVIRVMQPLLTQNMQLTKMSP